MSARRSDAAASPARGAVLVAVAVILGLVLIRSGLDTDGVVSAGDSNRRTTSSAPTSTTAATIRPPSQVTVLVANGSGVDLAAGRVSTALAQKGYRTATPTNAENVTSTAIYYVAGFEAEAEAVAVALGAPASVVASMPTPAPVANLAGAQVLVVLGPDLAPPG